MAQEFRAAVAQVWTLCGQVSGIRAVYHSEPDGIQQPPIAYLAEFEGVTPAETLGNTSWYDYHEITIRVLDSRGAGRPGADPAELRIFDFVDLFLTKFRQNRKLGNTCQHAQIVRYKTGYADLASTKYRMLDLVLSIQILKTS